MTLNADYSSQTAATIRCAACQHDNASGRKFCSQCGKSLWIHCESCESPCPIDETFCGTCGANVAEAIEATVTRVKDDLAAAQRLQEEHRFDEAAQLLTRIRKKENATLVGDLIEEAASLIEQLDGQRTRGEQDAATAMLAAKRYLDHFAYEKACAALATVPEPLQSDEFRALVHEVNGKRLEVLTLGGEIRELVQSGKTADLMSKLERLLTLQPKNEQAQTLVEQLYDKLCRAADQKSKAHRYPEALALIQRIPPSMEGELSKKIRARAEELAWLYQDLRTAPFVDNTLIDLADRFLKLVPDDKQVAGIRQQLEQRKSIRVKDATSPLPPWAAAPSETRFPFPVDWLGRSSRIAGWDSQNDVSQPGAFFVACGLALQGLGEGPVHANLVQGKKKSRPARGLFKRASGPETCWGFDIGASSLKAVKLVVNEEGEVEAPHFETIAHEENLGRLNEAEWADALRKAVELLKDKHDIGDVPVAISLRGSDVLSRSFDMPPVAEKQRRRLIELEAAHQVPIGLEKLSWDYQLFGDKAADSTPARPRVILLAAKQEHVNQRVELCRELGLNVTIAQSEPVALHNFAAFEFPPDDAADVPRQIALLDVGSTHSNLVLSGPEEFSYRSFPVCGNQVTTALIDKYNLTFDQAEQLKRRPCEAKRLSSLYRALDPVFASLVMEIERSLTSLTGGRQSEQPERLLCVGGGMHLHGLLRYLRHGESQTPVLD